MCAFLFCSKYASYIPISSSVFLILVDQFSLKYSTEVELYVVPVICSPICDQKIEVARDTYNHLTNLRLADSSSGESELKIDVLIGADYYWYLLFTNNCTTSTI